MSSTPGPAADRAHAELSGIRCLLAGAPLIDGHNDLLWELREQVGYDFDRRDIGGSVPGVQTDLPRLRAGGVGGQFWSVFVPSDLPGDTAVTATLEQLDGLQQMLQRYPDQLQRALTAADVDQAVAAGKIASLAGMEGGQSIGCSLGALRTMYALGARYLTLTHNENNPWADSATDQPVHGGLTRFGVEVVREMNRLGMMVDLSHVSEETMLDAMRVSDAPVIFSHSSARAVTDHPRNVPDRVLRMMPQDGGIVMINLAPGFVSEAVRAWNGAKAGEEARLKTLNPGDPGAVEAGLTAWTAANPTPQATLADVVAHIQHVREVAGINHVGLGADFDGIGSLPEDMGGVDAYPRILAALMAAGWTEADIRKIAGENLLRVMRSVEAVAASKSGERPSMARLEPASAQN
jgi:membrane dipeptidase